MLSVFGSRLNVHSMARYRWSDKWREKCSVEDNPQKEQNNSIQMIITFKGPCVVARHLHATSQSLLLLLLWKCASEYDRSNYLIVICIPSIRDVNIVLFLSFTIAARANTVSNIELITLEIPTQRLDSKIWFLNKSVNSIPFRCFHFTFGFSLKKNTIGRNQVLCTVRECERCHLET